MAKNQVQPRDEDQLPHHAEDYADQYAGEETFVDREHTITPKVTILQGLSPQVKRNNVAYVDGAQPGMIFLSSYHQPLVDGEKGIVFQPCLFQTPWEVRTPKTESQPANFVDIFEEPQETWTAHRSDKGYTYYTTPEGNIASQIHIHVGMIHIDDQCLPYAVRFSGTGMFVSKQWNGLIGSRRTESGKPAARFTYTYRMRVKSQTNAMGEWGQWSISPQGKATQEQMKNAHDLVMAFKENRATVERDAPGEGEGPAPDDAM
jgi:hypothetical protein